MQLVLPEKYPVTSPSMNEVNFEPAAKKKNTKKHERFKTTSRYYTAYKKAKES